MTDPNSSAVLPVTDQSLTALNAEFSTRSALELLAFVHATFGRKAAILCGMQQAGTALCHLADRAGLDFDVLFVDTGLLHPQTLATRDQLQATHPRLRVRTLVPEQDFASQCRSHGVLYLSPEGQITCCELRKTLPLRACKGDYHVFLGALRQAEGSARANVSAFALDPEMNALRAHPLARWTHDDLTEYLQKHPDVVRNPLHEMGFPTIGCFPCTTPVRPDEPERAGRWRHLAGVEYCGINPSDRKNSRNAPSVTLPTRYAAALQVTESASKT